MKTWNKMAACMLTAAMTFSAFPIRAFAQEGETTPTERPKNNNVCLQVKGSKETCNQTLKTTISVVNKYHHGKAVHIRLQGDAEGEGIVFPSGENIAIDFGGYTYTITKKLVGSPNTETNGFQLLSGSTITFANGTITSSESANAFMLVQNYSKLTLNNMELDGSNLGWDSGAYTLSNNNGYIEINDSTITAKENNVAFDLFHWPSMGYGKVTVKVSGNSTINGDIEYGGDKSVTPAEIRKNARLKIEGGTFNGALNVNPRFAESETNANIEISGGTFKESAEVYKAYVVKGLTLDEKGNVVKFDNGSAKLLEAIEDAKAYLDNDKYTEESRNNLKNIIDFVSLYANDDATTDEVEKACEALAAAVGCLAEVETPMEDNSAELAALKDVITFAKGYEEKQDEYEETSFAALKDALTQAQEVAAKESDATKDEIAAAKDALFTAITELKPAESETPIEDNSTELAALKDVITFAESYEEKQDQYEETSFAALKDALTQAQEVAAKESDATKDEIAAAKEALFTAIKNLQPVKQETPETPVDLSALHAIIEIAEATLADADLYTPESVAAVKEALANAKALDENATAETVNQAIIQLTKACAELEKVTTPSHESVDKTPLSKQIKIAEAYLTNGKTYTEASLAALQAAISGAKNAAAIEDLDASVMLEVIERLQDACAGLVEMTAPNPKPTPTPEPIVTPAAPDAINGAIKNTAGAEGNMALVTLSTLAAACVFVAGKKRKAE